MNRVIMNDDLKCIGIAKKWEMYRKGYKDINAKGSRGGKPVKYGYFINTNGKLVSFRINSAEEIWIRLHGIYKRRYLVCKICRNRFLVLIKSLKELEKPLDCPYCTAL